MADDTLQSRTPSRAAAYRPSDEAERHAQLHLRNACQTAAWRDRYAAHLDAAEHQRNVRIHNLRHGWNRRRAARVRMRTVRS